MNISEAKAQLEVWADWYQPKHVPWRRWRNGPTEPPTIEQDWIALLSLHPAGVLKVISRKLEDLKTPPSLLDMRRMLRDIEARLIPDDAGIATGSTIICPTCQGTGWRVRWVETGLYPHDEAYPCQQCGKSGVVLAHRVLKPDLF
jgi:hypothetical protein